MSIINRLNAIIVTPRVALVSGVVICALLVVGTTLLTPSNHQQVASLNKPSQAPVAVPKAVTPSAPPATTVPSSLPVAASPPAPAPQPQPMRCPDVERLAIAQQAAQAIAQSQLDYQNLVAQASVPPLNSSPEVQQELAQSQQTMENFPAVEAQREHIQLVMAGCEQ